MKGTNSICSNHRKTSKMEKSFANSMVFWSVSAILLTDEEVKVCSLPDTRHSLHEERTHGHAIDE